MARILLIHQAFVGPNEAGGTRHFELAQHLIRNEHSFTIVASNLSYLTGGCAVEGKGLVKEQFIDKVRVLRTYTYPSLHRSFFWRIVSFLSFMFTSVLASFQAGPVDLVIGTSPPIFQAFSAWLVSFLRRKPFFLEIRDLWPEFAIDMGILKNHILISMSRSLERFLYARATHIVVNSPAYKTYLTQKGISESKISLIPNGVDTSMFDPDLDGGAIRKRLDLEGKFIITYAGALGIANHLDTILCAADLLRDNDQIHFLIVGDGKERINLETEANRQNLPNVTFLGPRPKTEIPQILAASDVCIAILQDIPMFRTTYPNKVFDYMAAGRPTLLGIDGVIRQVIEAANGGIFFPPSNAEALAEIVVRLSKNPSEVKLMGQSARSYVVEHFDRNQQAEQLIDLFELMSHKRDRH
ncbi:MAG: glycosyltransferase family 4 protein [Anaerolineae bacterium]|nr:glycosyltransferase family 4 protein [Anaerolineae bacterium]